MEGEHVTGSSQRMNKRGGSLGIQLATDTTDEHIHGIGDGVEVVVPHVLQDLPAAQYPLRGAQQILQESEFSGGESNRATRAADDPAGRIELDVGIAEHDVVGRGRTSRQGAQTREELVDSERLRSDSRRLPRPDHERDRPARRER